MLYVNLMKVVNIQSNCMLSRRSYSENEVCQLTVNYVAMYYRYMFLILQIIIILYVIL